MMRPEDIDRLRLRVADYRPPSRWPLLIPLAAAAALAILFKWILP